MSHDHATATSTLSTANRTQSDFGRELQTTRVPLPPPAEQTQIAAFLDRETAKIDELVAEQRRLMELLKEKRQAVISHAVTKGLNPDAPMKPSGIEWLGEVPAHWECDTDSSDCVSITARSALWPTHLDEMYCRWHPECQTVTSDGCNDWTSMARRRSDIDQNMLAICERGDLPIHARRLIASMVEPCQSSSSGAGIDCRMLDSDR